MGIEARIGGNIVLNIIGMSIRSSLSTISNSFSLLLSPGKNATQTESNLDFKAGDTAVIEIDGTPVINGFIDTVRVFYTAQQHEVEIIGRDRTSDFIDSSVQEINIEESVQFEKLLRTTLDAMGLEDIGVENLISSSADLLIRETKNISSEIGQTGFEFIDQFARLKQVLLKGDGKGNIQMTRGGGDQAIKTALVNIPDRPENNIIKGEFVQSNINRFNIYTVKSQEDFSSPSFDLGVDEVINNSGSVSDDGIRSTRQFIFEAEENSTSEECVNRATWEADLRRAKGTKVRLTVLGHSVRFVEAGFGEVTVLWQPNSTVPVVDVFSNIKAVMLIESVHYQLSPVTGSTTEITLVPKDSYTIQASQNAAEARISIIGKEDE